MPDRAVEGKPIIPPTPAAQEIARKAVPELKAIKREGLVTVAPAALQKPAPAKSIKERAVELHKAGLSVLEIVKTLHKEHYKLVTGGEPTRASVYYYLSLDKPKAQAVPAAAGLTYAPAPEAPKPVHKSVVHLPRKAPELVISILTDPELDDTAKVHMLATFYRL